MPVEPLPLDLPDVPTSFKRTVRAFQPDRPKRGNGNPLKTTGEASSESAAMRLTIGLGGGKIDDILTQSAPP